MTIFHKVDDFIYQLFPGVDVKNDPEALKEQLKRYYTYGAYEPKVRV